jgi:GNAT superfamily N-acetyltransferase
MPEFSDFCNLIKNGNYPDVYYWTVNENVVCAAIISFMISYTGKKLMYLDMIVVNANHRKLGYGKQAIEDLKKFGCDIGLQCMRETAAIEFYNKIGTIFEEEWIWGEI